MTEAARDLGLEEAKEAITARGRERGFVTSEDLLEAVLLTERPDIFPMDYLASGRHLFLRSGPGQKLVDLARNPHVAFEAEGDAEGFRWSVVLRGTARRLDRDDEIEASGVLDLRSTSPTGKYDYLEIAPVTLTGRRFRPQR